MSETKLHGSRRWQAKRFDVAEDCIYPMPTVDEVTKAGYPASYWNKVKEERDAFIEKFNADPEFAARARAQAADDHAEAERREAERKSDARERATRHVPDPSK